jgi:2-amino-4-hydroxy-6-hydroxymethyldihydropteridine diphosphokinase
MVAGSRSVFLGVGSNLGDRRSAVVEAGLRLTASGFRMTRGSSLYETEPVGGPPQGWFLNGVFEGETELDAQALLGLCLETERAMGRGRAEPNGPRIIDLDILLFGDLVVASPSLTVPHPRMHLRRFVLTPLCEIAPFVRHPTLQLTVSELLGRCTDEAQVRFAGAGDVLS